MDRYEKTYSTIEKDIFKFLNAKFPNAEEITIKEASAYITAQIIIAVHDGVNSYLRNFEKPRVRRYSDIENDSK